MFLPMFLISAAAVLVLAVLAIKLKKVRGLFVILTVLALLPTAVLGLITFGQGSLINYPGDPARAVTGMISALQKSDYEEADSHVLGTLGLQDASEPALQEMFTGGRCFGIRSLHLLIGIIQKSSYTNSWAKDQAEIMPDFTFP